MGLYGLQKTKTIENKTGKTNLPFTGYFSCLLFKLFLSPQVIESLFLWDYSSYLAWNGGEEKAQTYLISSFSFTKQALLVKATIAELDDLTQKLSTNILVCQLL